MSTMDVSKLSANQLKQMTSDKKRVILLYRKDDGDEVERIPNDISEPLIRVLSTYCHLKLPVQNKSASVAMQEKPSIIIQTEDRRAVFDILNWILRYASGDRKLPNLGEKPLYNALVLNRTAELLGLPIIMLTEIKEAMKSLTGSYLSSSDVLAIAKASAKDSHDWKLVVDNTAQQVHDALMVGNSDKAGRIREVVSGVPGMVEAVKMALYTKQKEQTQRDTQKAANRGATRRAQRGPPGPR